MQLLFIISNTEAFQIAVEENNLEAVKHILHHCNKKEIIIINKKKAFQIAVIRNYFEIAKVLLQTNEIDINQIITTYYIHLFIFK